MLFCFNLIRLATLLSSELDVDRYIILGGDWKSMKQQEIIVKKENFLDAINPMREKR